MGFPPKTMGKNHKDFYKESETNSCEITRNQLKKVWACQLEAERTGCKDELGVACEYLLHNTSSDA